MNNLGYKFIDLDGLSPSISITNKGRIITQAFKPYRWNYCYINLKMEDGIYYITYRSHTNRSIMIGATQLKDFDGEHLFYQKESNSLYFYENGSNAYGNNGKVINEPYWGNSENKIFVLKYDFNNKTISIKDDLMDNYLIVFSSFKGPLYPFVELNYYEDSVELLLINKKE